jgi:hypothetical protein
VPALWWSSSSFDDIHSRAYRRSVLSTPMLDELASEDQLEDDELCIVCWKAPVADEAQCGDCLAFLRRNNYDRITPHQRPTLSWPEERQLRDAMAWRHDFEWLMAPQADRLPTTLEEIVSRPEWQKDAACNGAGTYRANPYRQHERPQFHPPPS